MSAMEARNQKQAARSCGSDAVPCSVLFLDVDGVLNRCGKSATRLESDLIDNLVHVVEQTDCRIVVSSTWRWMPGPMGDLTRALEDRGLTILSSTPVHQIRTQGGLYTSAVRGDEIQAWMDEHGTPERFCIVDDEGDMGHLKHALIQTNSFEGMTPDHARRIIDALNAPILPPGGAVVSKANEEGAKA